MHFLVNALFITCLQTNMGFTIEQRFGYYWMDLTKVLHKFCRELVFKHYCDTYAFLLYSIMLEKIFSFQLDRFVTKVHDFTNSKLQTLKY